MMKIKSYFGTSSYDSLTEALGGGGVYCLWISRNNEKKERNTNFQVKTGK